MMLVQIEGNWINPEHIVSVVNGKRRGFVECEVLLTAGHFIRLEQSADDVVAEIAYQTRIHLGTPQEVPTP